MSIDELLIKGITASGGLGVCVAALIALVRYVLIPMQKGAAKQAELHVQTSQLQAEAAKAHAVAAGEHARAAESWKATAELQLRMVRLLSTRKRSQSESQE